MKEQISLAETSGESCHAEPPSKSWRVLQQPCPSCPWRMDQSAEDIPGFSLEMARDLAATCPNERGHGPNFGAAIFACHQSKVGGEMPCAGWLATVGHSHPNVRLAVIQGRVDPEALTPGANWPALHGNYGEVLQKLEGSDDEAARAESAHEHGEVE
ncbi:DUF6283 family protein [Acidovorax sp.]|uniref:DUF6283 family protein n=1 Tax=Acidovorax sp. TaxID=1872122 RepID=UPI00391F9082